MMTSIIEQARETAYRSVNTILVQRNWLLGKFINEAVLNNSKAEYGKRVIQTLARELTARYGVGFTQTNLYNYAQFYSYFPINEQDEIFHAVCGKFNNTENTPALELQITSPQILGSLRPKFDYRLSWTHYRILLQEDNKEARDWYVREAAEQMWSVRTLQRNVSSAYYQRMLSSQKKEVVEQEMKANTAALQDKLDFIKNPVIAEFLGFALTPMRILPVTPF